MKLTDTFIRRVNGNGKVQKHSDGGHLAAITDPAAVGELLRKIDGYEGNSFVSRALPLYVKHDSIRLYLLEKVE